MSSRTIQVPVLSGAVPAFLCTSIIFLTFPPISSPCSVHLARRTRLTDPESLPDCLPYLRRPILKPMVHGPVAHGPWPIPLHARIPRTLPRPMHTHAHPHPYLDSPFSTLFPFPPDITSLLQLPPCITHQFSLVDLFAPHAFIPGTARRPLFNSYPAALLTRSSNTFVPFISLTIPPLPPPPPSPPSLAPAGIPSLGPPAPRSNGVLAHLHVPRPCPVCSNHLAAVNISAKSVRSQILVFLLSVWTSTATCNPPNFLDSCCVSEPPWSHRGAGRKRQGRRLVPSKSLYLCLPLCSGQRRPGHIRNHGSKIPTTSHRHRKSFASHRCNIIQGGLRGTHLQ